jgi:hypothetical protein
LRFTSFNEGVQTFISGGLQASALTDIVHSIAIISFLNSSFTLAFSSTRKAAMGGQHRLGSRTCRRPLLSDLGRSLYGGCRPEADLATYRVEITNCSGFFHAITRYGPLIEPCSR